MRVKGGVRREKDTTKFGRNGWGKIRKCEREGPSLLSKVLFTVQSIVQSTE